ncbi:MAG: HIGH nucleotidyl transferase [Clostridiales bacterium]|nr:HIGH nucleotidyl transferase [Clostridiales bacterium]
MAERRQSMGICGVVAEYDPFHRGHSYHLEQARELSGCEKLVCFMSGSFTQRGAPAVFTPAARARAALENGADAVLLLPYTHAVREAEHFALGGVALTAKLGCTHLSFGCETDDIRLLQTAAELLENEDDALREDIRRGLEQGLSFAAARGGALRKRTGDEDDLLSLPNNTLAICYLRAIRRLGVSLIPVPVKRTGDYHAVTAQPMPSASYVRSRLAAGDDAVVRDALGEAAFALFEGERAAGRVLMPGGDKTGAMLLYRLQSMTPEELRLYPDCREGIENRILSMARSAASAEELVDAVKTRRYTRGRITRLLCHVLTGTKEADLPELPSYTRVLGFRRDAAALLRFMQDRAEAEGLSILSRPVPERDGTGSFDEKADKLWFLAAGLAPENAYKEKCVITG